LEHLYREVRAPRIYEGASEVQRGIIARDLYAAEDRTGPEGVR
jgi:alkylation response protein AidB-like acyl-CoA dehydrogenase